MNDLISRQAAIDAAIEAVDEWDGGYNLTRADMIADAINNNVPSVQPEKAQLSGEDATLDLISRQAAIDEAEEWIEAVYCDYEEQRERDAIKHVINGIKALPSAQPEIIACGDCKHWICHDRRCGYWNHGVKPLMWCSQAERKENR